MRSFTNQRVFIAHSFEDERIPGRFVAFSFANDMNTAKTPHKYPMLINDEFEKNGERKVSHYTHISDRDWDYLQENINKMGDNPVFTANVYKKKKDSGFKVDIGSALFEPMAFDMKSHKENTISSRFNLTDKRKISEEEFLEMVSSGDTRFNNLDLSNIPDSTFEDLDLSGAVFNNCDLSGKTLEGTDLTGTTFKSCDMEKTDFDKCVMSEGKSPHISFLDGNPLPTPTRFVDCGMDESKITKGSEPLDVIITDCDTQDAEFDFIDLNDYKLDSKLNPELKSISVSENSSRKMEVNSVIYNFEANGQEGEFVGTKDFGYVKLGNQNRLSFK